MKECCEKMDKCLSSMQNVALLLCRATLGYVFITAGWGKLNNLDSVVQFFDSLGIPMANLQAPFVAGVEFVGGILILAGLFTRFASIPLMVIMIVAIITTKWADAESVLELLKTTDFAYFVMLAILATIGSGTLSLCRFWKKS